MLALAFIFTSIPAPTFAKTTAKGGKVQCVTQAKDSDGNTITVKYNKKGLVSKTVRKMSYKDAASDTAITTTTTYSYNKKNRISKKTCVSAEKVTTYETDKTTGKQIKSTLGSVTTTTKTVTTYKYNKKGVATSSTETTTKTKSGSKTEKTKNRNYAYEIEKTDGKLVYDWNDYDKKAESEIIVTGDLDKALLDKVTTTTYRDNGNGTYSVITDSTTTDQNCDYSYIGSDGHEYNSISEMPAGVTAKERKITINNQNKDITTEKTETLYEDKSVTTSTYKHDSKKRLKSRATTTVDSSNNTRLLYNYTDTTYYPDGKKESANFTSYTKNVNSSTETFNYNETFTYKKGLMKKWKYSNKGIKNSNNISTTGLPNYTATDTAGHTTQVTGSGADWVSASTVTYANGKMTSRYEEKPYKETKVVDGTTTTTDVPADPATVKTKAVKATPSNETETYKYDKQKNVSSYKYSGTDVEIVNQLDETFGNTIYEGYDQDQNPVPVEVSVTHTYSENGKNENAVKKGTTALKKTLTMVSGQKHDRATAPGYDCRRITYTLKVKKVSKKLKPDVVAQQWSIQNGPLNGYVGLSFGF
jgi:hypothetical protein